MPWGISLIGVHSDDLGVCSNPEESERVESELKVIFANDVAGSVKVQSGNELLWLGINIKRDRKRREMYLSQKEYIEVILQKFSNMMEIPVKDIKLTKSPAPSDLFDYNDDTKTTEMNTKLLSLTMSFMFLASRTRPDLLTVVSYLSTRAFHHCPRDDDILIQLMGYTLATMNKVLTLSSDNLQMYAFTDSSLNNCTIDGTSQSAMVISLGYDRETGKSTGFVIAASNKGSDVCLSTAEAELGGLTNSLKFILWLKKLLECIGFPDQKNITVFQDNQAAISMATLGKGNFRNTKHIQTRHFFMHQHVKNNNIRLLFLETEMMIADILTKPLHGGLLQKLTAMLLNEMFDFTEHGVQPKRTNKKRKIAT
jgi:hypothetical protein